MYLFFSLRPAYTQLQINSTPKGAQVFIDDDLTLAGTTPFTSERLAKGSHTLKFQLASYLPKSVSVTVAGDGKTQTVSATLEPNFAETVVETADGADIYVDNQRVGSGRWTGRLDAGKHIVEARKASHVSSRKVVDAVVGKPVTEHFDALIPLLGKLSVTSSPAKASVSLDGKVLGTTPGMFPDILIGEHTLVVSKENYLPVQKKITVEEGKIVQESFELKAGQATQTIAGTSLESVRKENDIVDMKAGQPAQTIADTDTESGRKNGDIMDIFPELEYDELVYVEGGTFTMGATPEQGSDAKKNEKPAHRVTLSSYYIGKYEVTQALWKAVMGKNKKDLNFLTTGKNKPVLTASWNDCQEFIQELNARTGKKFRLPTEAEWEYAARGGNKSKGYKYSGSNDINAVANSGFFDDVGNKAPNELGLYDMSGNAEEWCSDWYGEYSGGEQTNPEMEKGLVAKHVIRGGRCFISKSHCRVSFREYRSPDFRGGCGLRLVLDESLGERKIGQENIELKAGQSAQTITNAKGSVLSNADISTNNYANEIDSEYIDDFDTESEEEVYIAVEEMPMFPGGEEALMKYIRDNLQYPQIAVEKGLEGLVTVRFVVNKDGYVQDVTVARSVHELLDREAVRVVQSLPRFAPGRQNGKVVSVYYNVPVVFRLE